MGFEILPHRSRRAGPDFHRHGRVSRNRLGLGDHLRLRRHRSRGVGSNLGTAASHWSAGNPHRCDRLRCKQRLIVLAHRARGSARHGRSRHALPLRLRRLLLIRHLPPARIVLRRTGGGLRCARPSSAADHAGLDGPPALIGRQLRNRIGNLMRIAGVDRRHHRIGETTVIVRHRGQGGLGRFGQGRENRCLRHDRALKFRNPPRQVRLGHVARDPVARLHPANRTRLRIGNRVGAVANPPRRLVEVRLVAKTLEPPQQPLGRRIAATGNETRPRPGDVVAAGRTRRTGGSRRTRGCGRRRTINPARLRQRSRTDALVPLVAGLALLRRRIGVVFGRGIELVQRADALLELLRDVDRPPVGRGRPDTLKRDDGAAAENRNIDRHDRLTSQTASTGSRQFPRNRRHRRPLHRPRRRPTHSCRAATHL
jgi:hypothetical protein